MRKLLCLLFACSFVIISSAQFGGEKKQIDSLLTHFIRKASIPGLSVAVARENKIIYDNSFGVADITTQQPLMESNQFRIGSVTKLFTTVAFIKMIEEGLLKDNDPVEKYFPNLPANYRNITLTQLAAHTSGIRHYARNEVMNGNKIEYENLEKALVRFINDSLISKPGEKYNYSSYGYTLLGAVMEKVKRQKFPDILKEYVFIPAGMKNTEPEVNDLMANRTKFYYPSQTGQFSLAQQDNYSYKWPAGGFVSTASDLVRFGSSLIEGKLVSKPMLSYFFTSQKRNDGKETGVGYGFRIGRDADGQLVVHHGGESEGARAFLLIYPEKKLAVAMLANVFRAPLLEGEAETIAWYFFEKPKDVKFLKKNIVFPYTAKDGDKTAHGSIAVTKQHGVINDFFGKQLEIVAVKKYYRGTRVIALSSGGIINIWVRKENEKYNGKWGYDKPINFIEIDTVH